MEFLMYDLLDVSGIEEEVIRQHKDLLNKTRVTEEKNKFNLKKSYQFSPNICQIDYHM